MTPEWTRLMAGSTHNSIYMPVFQELRILLPPVSEQEIIALALGEADALIESLEQLLAKKRLIKQALMQQLLTGSKRLSGFEGRWDVFPMGDLFTFSGGYSASRDQLSGDGHLYLHYGDIHAAQSPFLDVAADAEQIPRLDISLGDVSSRSLLADGDVVFVDASEDVEGASKHVVVVNPDARPFISGLHTIVAKRKTDLLVREYLGYCFQTAAVRDQFRFYSVGTKVTGISKRNIGKVLLAVPSPKEQEVIAEILLDSDSELAALEIRRSKARQLKQGMMQNLLTGKIRLM